ncbi:FadR family transcriptional regulator [Pseudonocardia sp. ICBG1122]|nr:FadR family transcriptional regulator [Pseudonocardia pini]
MSDATRPVDPRAALDGLLAPRTSRRRAEKLAVLVASDIADEIVEAGLRPGDPLPNEARMLERMDVSRATLREALRVLETQGVIAIRTGRGGGPYVAQPQSKALADLLTINFRVLGVTFEEILFTRDAIEPALAGQAALHRTDADLVRLEELVDLMERASSPGDYSRLNREFHTTVAVASRNRPLAVMWAAVGDVADGQGVGAEWDDVLRTAGNRAHRRLVAALEASDAGKAQRIMGAHVTAFHNAMAKNHAETMSSLIATPEPRS